ncbi:hypothetical protein QBC43DRAFT_131872 [Cladorrhinum sp. PSN259]|nr:hypothetical protein QBC43DRAFT_131872 [Cladorrhinum sp. PSN259]
MTSSSTLAYHSRAPTPSTVSRGPVAGGKFVAVGIDFGTTYCGVSWALSDAPDIIHEITEWPAEFHLNSREDQVPTQLDLKSGKWGYEVTSQMKPIKWFKLLLLRDADMVRNEIRDSIHLKDARKQIADNKLTPVKAVSMYLEKLWKHTYAQLASRFDVDNMPLRVAITVPAIWPPYAEQAMREAAANAGITVDRDIGMTTLDLVQEPEAAALSIFLDRRDLPDIQPRESFVVCDAGGGTVDVISYTVQSISPFRIGECVKGDGKLAGAYLVDEAFAAYLNYETNLKIKSLSIAEHNMFVTKEWEMGAKRNFTGNPTPARFVMTPPSKAFGKFAKMVNKTEFSISREAVSGFFEQSMTGIRTLISDQIKGVEAETHRKPKKILLVGGFGGSQYIYNQLEIQYPKQILRPLGRPWSAVAHGAVIRLLQDKMSSMSQTNLTPRQKATIAGIPEVVTRKSRYSYGIVCDKPIAALQDYKPNLDKIKYDPEGVQVTSRMDWYLNKGDEVSKKSPVLIGYQQFAKANNAPGKCVFVIRYSSADVPPARLDTEVMELCRIECEWDRPFSEWKEVGSTNGQVGGGVSTGTGHNGNGNGNGHNGGGWRKYDDLTLAMRFGGQPKWTIRVGKNEVEHDVKVEYSG